MATQQPRRSHTGCVPSGLLLWLWPLLDRIISKWLGIEPLRKDRISIISIELRRHRGQPIRLDDATMIVPEDLLVELHLNNAWFLHNRGKVTNSAGKVSWRVSLSFAEDLKYLAGQLAERRFRAEISALHGITTLYSPAQRLGFTVKELPQGLRKRLTTFYLSGLRQIHYLGGSKEYTTPRKPPVLKEVWMSRSTLVERYGTLTGSTPDSAEMGVYDILQNSSQDFRG